MLSQLSLAQLQQLRQEKEQEKNQLYQELLRRGEIIIAYNGKKYKGTEITSKNSIEYKEEFMEMGKKYETMEKEIQEIDLLIMQYQKENTRALALQQAFLSPPATSKNLSTQKVLKSIESLQNWLIKTRFLQRPRTI